MYPGLETDHARDRQQLQLFSARTQEIPHDKNRDI